MSFQRDNWFYRSVLVAMELVYIEAKTPCSLWHRHVKRHDCNHLVLVRTSGLFKTVHLDLSKQKVQISIRRTLCIFFPLWHLWFWGKITEESHLFSSRVRFSWIQGFQNLCRIIQKCYLSVENNAMNFSKLLHNLFSLEEWINVYVQIDRREQITF